MCISVLTTSHPKYPFILISNRDEFLSRPTAQAKWWDPPHEHVLGGRDLQSPAQGTWLGITKQGRIAILTNFREDGDYAINRDKSRGAIVNSYLCLEPDSDTTEEEHAKNMIRDVGFHDVGGFTLLFGKLRKPRGDEENMPGLAVVSNRTRNPEELHRIATRSGVTTGLSNSHYGDESWPKVVNGENCLSEVIENNATSSQEALIDALFAVLSTDTLPARQEGESWQMYVRHMRESILIPPAKGEATEEHDADALRTADEDLKNAEVKREIGKGAYGTHKQTVILVNREGQVTFMERTLFDGDGREVPIGKGDVKWRFEIDGWNDR